MNKLAIPLIALACLSACSDSNDADLKISGNSTFPPLPSNSSERVTLTGKMSFWMYEGEAGCYGTITSGSEEVNLWIDADSCGEKVFDENEQVSVEVTFSPDNQYGPGATYTITRFN